MQDSNKHHVHNLLETIVYPTIATVDKSGNPWAAPQFMAYDPADQTYYWCADKQSQHGQNIMLNPNVYIVAYDSMAVPGAGDGVYMRATAEAIHDAAEIDKAFALLLKKHVNAPYWSAHDIKAPSSPVGLFKAHVQQAWINKDRQIDGHFVLYRENVSL